MLGELRGGFSRGFTFKVGPYRDSLRITQIYPYYHLYRDMHRCYMLGSSMILNCCVRF